MFEKKTRLENELEDMRNSIKTLDNKYWDLWHKHERLLRHLGLSEHKIPEAIELRANGGQEPGRENLQYKYET